ncbi:tetratricopeptide repeat protein [Candidatus Acetothermia bacterium]|nr:tetratricopeptide repeat protein [Candidatus Acetothermia bacterium]
MLQQKRFFIVGTYRTEEAKESDRLAELIRTLEKHEHGRVIKLGPLALHETLELLRQLPLRLKEQDLFYGLLSQSAEGNPLFLLAILQNLFERGYLRVKGRYWTLAGERLEKLKELAIPPTLQELILQRLNRLANTDRQLLGLASVLGRSFETSLLLRAWDGGKEECHASLVRMVSAQLLAEKHGTFEFSHDRIREMVYTQLPETIRRLMHQRVMRALEAQQSEQINEYAMPLARHAFEAEEWGKAMEYAAKALREAHRQCRLRDGLDLSAIGLKAADMLPASEDPSLGLHRYDLLDGRSEILYLLGKTEEQEQTLNQMEIVAAKLNDGAKRAKALVKKGGLYRAAGEFDKSEKVTQEALALYEKAGDKRGMGSCLMVLAAAKNLRGEYANAIQTNLQALGLLEAIGDRANQVRCLGNLGICHNNLGEYEEALRYYHRILENFKEVQDNPNRASDLNGLGLLYFNLGQYEKALAHCGEALALRREIGDRRGQVFSLTNLGDACCAIGKYEEALRYYQEAQKICKEVGNRWIEGHGLGGIGDVHRSRGEHSEALEYYSRAMKTFKELNANAEYLFYLTWASRAHLLNGAKGIALEFSTEAMDMLKQGWTHVTPHDTLFTHSLALEANGQDSEAAGHLERAYASLMEQADKLKDNSLRDSFLNRIRAHREILDAWEKLDAPPHWSSDR